MILILAKRMILSLTLVTFLMSPLHANENDNIYGDYAVMVNRMLDTTEVSDLLTLSTLMSKFTKNHFVVRENVKPELLQEIYAKTFYKIFTSGHNMAISKSDVIKKVFSHIATNTNKEDAIKGAVMHQKNFAKLVGLINQTSPIAKEESQPIQDAISKNIILSGSDYMEKEVDYSKFTSMAANVETWDIAEYNIKNVDSCLKSKERVDISSLLDAPAGPKRIGNPDEYLTTFIKDMNESIPGTSKEILDIQRKLKSHNKDPSTRIIVSLLGTTGNGKTFFYKSLAKAIYGKDDKEGLFIMQNLTSKFSLYNYMGPPKGVIGSDKETEFEEWIVKRIESGKGGVILLDELLSLSGLADDALQERAGIINSLYSMLDEGIVHIRGQDFDVSNFVIGITGNSLQESFMGLSNTPELDDEIERIEKSVTREEIVKYFQAKHIDAPKVARFGTLIVKGPFTNDKSLTILRSSMKNVNEDLAKKGIKLSLKIDDEILKELVSRLSTIELGFREVEKGLQSLVYEPLYAIANDLSSDKNQDVEVKLVDGNIEWYVGKKQVYLTGELVDEVSGLRNERWSKTIIEGANNAPQLKDLNTPQTIKMSPDAIEATLVHEIKGHWQVGVLLSGENSTDSISIVPAKNYLGYVSPKRQPDKPIEETTLRTIFNRSVMLQAGHRAVFEEGIYAGGGGGQGFRDIKDMAKGSDDLAKVESNIQYIISNHMIEVVTETSTEEIQKSFKDVYHLFSKYVADEVIRYGNKTGFGDEVMDIVREEKYLRGTVIDEIAERELKKSTQKDLLLAQSIKAAKKKIIESENLELLASPKKAEIVLNKMIDAIFIELLAISKDSAIKTKIKTLKNATAKVKTKVPEVNMDKNCLELLAKMLAASQK